MHYLAGTSTVESTCIKFAKSSSAQLKIIGNGAKLLCLTTNYRPAILCAKDDDNVGEKISGSSGSPSGYYATYALYFDYVSSGVLAALNNLHIRHALYGLYFYQGTNHTLSSVQLINCQRAFGGFRGDFIARNALVYSSSNIVEGDFCTLHGENMTLDSAWRLNASYYTNWIYLTNTLLSGIYYLSGWDYSGVYNATATSSDYQAIGTATHYLSGTSPRHNAGTTSINPDLLAALRRKTTYPPVILTNRITTDTTLTPQAQRDTDAIDQGYHYDPLDWAIGNLSLTNNARLTLTNGVVVGLFGTNGVKLQTGAQLISQGDPVNLNRFVRYYAVQEQANSTWTGGTNWTTLKDDLVSGTLPAARLRFSQFLLPANGGWHFQGGSKLGLLSLRDSCFWGGTLTWNTNGASSRLFSLSNNVFERVTNAIGTGSDPLSVHARNNLFKEGKLDLKPVSTNNWTFADNLFDSATLLQNANGITNGWNGYHTNVTRLSPNAANDVVTNITYQSGPLAIYYQPTNSPLLNAGSTNATNAGLSWFTTTTNQVRETNSVVDLGPHWVALDANGLPLDSDSDGLPSFLEDADGDGVVDSGETDWNNASDLGLRVRITRPRPGSILP